jgi:hypothetical protein
MDNSKIESNGLKAVRNYERQYGRSKITRVFKCGYDLVSKTPEGADERHIEVKATNKKAFTQRWLEQREQDALAKDSLFYLYLVTEAQSAQPTIHIFEGSQLKKRFERCETKYLYTFLKADFHG